MDRRIYNKAAKLEWQLGYPCYKAGQTDVYAFEAVVFSALVLYSVTILQTAKPFLTRQFFLLAFGIHPCCLLEVSKKKQIKPGKFKRTGVFASMRWSQQDPRCLRGNTLVKNVYCVIRARARAYRRPSPVSLCT